MTYTRGLKDGRRMVTSKRHKLKRLALTGGVLLPLLAGLYLLSLVLAPQFYGPLTRTSTGGWNEEPVAQATDITENRVYLPKIRINIPFKSGDESVLFHNAWHRFPERGDPVKGGNFILSAHRFSLGSTPGQTYNRSPFYNLDEMNAGDPIYVDFEGVRYKYEVTRRYTVKPTQIEIEAPSAEPKLTLYSCTLKGSFDGREVLDATLVQSNVDPTQPLL